MVTVTMNDVVTFRNAGDILGDVKLPLKAAYKLNKLKKAVAKEGEYYVEKFQEIINEYAKKDENGNVVFSDDGEQILIKDGMVEDCNKALDELQTMTIEIDNCNLALDDFGEDVECTSEELDALMPFLN